MQETPESPTRSSMDVDHLAKSMAGALSVEEAGVFSATAPHPRFADYKSTNRWVKNSQENRRTAMLEKQKALRFEKTLESRGITEEDVDENYNKKNEKSRSRNYYSNLLMHSEWLVDVPQNFATEWLMVPSPSGRRSIIVASDRYTYCFTKNGYRKMGFQSLLPGGGSNAKSGQGETILDCIFCEKTKTFYMLDCILWSGQQIGENEFVFRHFWLQSRVEELDLDKISPKNQFRFVLLPKYNCDVASIEAAMNTPTDYQIDGLLFYCNAAFYAPGLTPLVGWLKPFMLREILNVQNLPPDIRPPMAGPNKDHESTTAEFIQDFNAEAAAKKKASPPKKSGENDMKE